jgi:hypothetical protein
MHVEPLHQRGLMVERQLSVRLESQDVRTVELRARLEGPGVRRIALTAPTTVRLEPHEPTRAALAIRPEAVPAVEACRLREVVVEAFAAGADREPLGRLDARVEGTPPRCGRFFAADSVWNRPLRADAPIDRGSPSLVGELRRQVDDNYRARFGPEINAHQYGVPIYTVARSQPTIRVALEPSGEHTRELQAGFTAVPLPAEARPARGTDRHLVVWQPATDTMWEFWALARGPDGWRASWGGIMRDVSRGPGYFEPAGGGVEWGATATGLPLAGGLITVAELERGRIDHALAFAVPEARAGSWAAPAQRTDGESQSRDAIPEGARFRLDPDLELDQLDLPPLTRMMAEAVQRYGMILRDQAGVVAFYGEDPASAGSDPYPQLLGGQTAAEALRSFPWDRLQVVRMRRGS